MISDNDLRLFHARRPRTGKAFYCLGDALALLHIAATGNVDRPSETNKRAITILTIGDLIATGSGTAYVLTSKGKDLVERIKGMPL